MGGGGRGFRGQRGHQRRREEGREVGREGERERGREGGRQRGRKGRRERAREGGRLERAISQSQVGVIVCDAPAHSLITYIFVHLISHLLRLTQKLAYLWLPGRQVPLHQLAVQPGGEETARRVRRWGGQCGGWLQGGRRRGRGRGPQEAGEGCIGLSRDALAG